MLWVKTFKIKICAKVATESQKDGLRGYACEQFLVGWGLIICMCMQKAWIEKGKIFRSGDKLVIKELEDIVRHGGILYSVFAYGEE